MNKDGNVIHEIVNILPENYRTSLAQFLQVVYL